MLPLIMVQVHCPFYWVNQIAAKHRCPLGSHTCTSINLCFGGSGILIHGDRRESYGPTSIIVTQANQVYALQQLKSGLVVCVLVRGCSAERIRMGCYDTDATLQRTAQELRSLIQGGVTAAQQRIELLVGLIVIQLVEAHATAAEPGLAARAQAIIDAEFQTRLSLPKLAARLHISVDHLRERFRHGIGESPTRYLLRRRMTSAQELLRSSNIPVFDVARLCGYEDPQYFSRQFHRTIGCSPTRWRQDAPHHPP